MMRSRFDEQLSELNSELIKMGSLCENVIAMSAKALLDGDIALAKKLRNMIWRSTRQSVTLKIIV